MRPARIRMRVVLPAPSGPTSPVISPGAMRIDTPSSAGFCILAKRLTTASATATGSDMTLSSRRGSGVGHSDAHRCTLAQALIRVVDDDAQAVDEVGSQRDGFNGLRREFRGG